MITHEEARNLLNELVPTDAITPSQIDDLHIYITEQEKKEQRAKKEHELLGLFQIFIKKMDIKYVNFLDCDGLTYNHCQFPKHHLTGDKILIDLFKQIKQLEEELK